jgi:hypothetical protein
LRARIASSSNTRTASGRVTAIPGYFQDKRVGESEGVEGQKRV